MHSSYDCPGRHTGGEGHDDLAQLLSNAGRLKARSATDGSPIQHGEIVVAPPDLHLMVDDEKIALSRGPHENRARPAIDVLFRSAAVAYGPRVLA